MEQRSLFARAIQDFRYARSQAALEQLTARLTRRSAELLSFEEVREKLHAIPAGTRKVENIPLDAIVGSVGRYADFTRGYWPLSGTDEQRWAKVKLAVTDLLGVPPIDVYQIGDAYFVQDGNHRVSVFREMGASHIQAHVTKLTTKVPLSADDDIDDIIIKAEYIKFLENTRLDQLRPEADIRLSVPGAYKDLEEHIRIYQHYISQEQNRDVPLHEAVTEWYDRYYAVVIKTINRLGILRDFPNHTEGDIYMRVWEHRGKLMEKTKIAVSVDLATQDLAVRKGISVKQIFSRLISWLYKRFLPEEFSSGPVPGTWRKQMMSMQHRKDCLFGYVLVPMSSDHDLRKGLQQALVIAKRENSTLYGLHVLAPGATEDTPRVCAIKTTFEQACKDEGVDGYFSFTRGKVTPEIIERARWTDLVVTTLSHPPGKKKLAKLSPGFDALIRTLPSPILAVPGIPSHFRRALVAYDGSPKAREALFIAVYMAHRWNTKLVVLTVLDDENPSEKELQDLRAYLEKSKVQPTYIEGKLPVREAILQTVASQQCDLILIGGYGKAPFFEMLLGSTVDEVLRISRVPVLVCR